MRSELAGLNGGSKQFWLRVHRKEVEAYYFLHGPEATMLEFNMKPDTLEAFLKRKSSDDRINKLSESDRWVLKMAKEDVREVRRRVADLESWRVEVEPVIAVGRALLDSTMEKIRVKVEHPALLNDPLRLANFGEKSKK